MGRAEAKEGLLIVGTASGICENTVEGVVEGNTGGSERERQGGYSNMYDLLSKNVMQVPNPSHLAGKAGNYACAHQKHM